MSDINVLELIGAKEVEIVRLRMQVMELQQVNQKLSAEVTSAREAADSKE